MKPSGAGLLFVGRFLINFIFSACYSFCHLMVFFFFFCFFLIGGSVFFSYELFGLRFLAVEFVGTWVKWGVGVEMWTSGIPHPD